MKKVLKTLLVVTVLALVLTAFTGCELLDKIMGLLPSTECEHTGGTATCAAQAICEKCGEPYGEKLAHTPQTILEIHPTCTEAGRTEGSKCSVCGEILVAPQEVAATGHDYHEVGCLNTCLNCGKVEGEHVWKDATCTEPKTCTECGKTDGKALGHSGGTATCTQKAVCEVCNEEYGELAEHTEVDIPDVEATCGTAGSTGGKKCSVCEAVTVEPTVVPATGKHTEEDIAAVEPTCGESGWTAGKKCSVCGEIIVKPTEVSATGEHSYVWTTTPPTATEAGHTVVSCKNCSTVKEYDDVKAITSEGGYVLTWEDIVGVVGTGKNGTYGDGEVVVRNDVFALHTGAKITTDNGKNYSWADGYTSEGRINFGSKTQFKDAGYITNGIEFTITQKATVKVWWMNATNKDTEIRQIGIYDLSGKIVAQSNAEGKKDTKEIYEVELEPGTYIIGNVVNHNYICKIGVFVCSEHDWKDATCTEAKTCSKCGLTSGEPLGHDWTEATCTEPKTCNTCKATEGEARGHVYVDGVCDCGLVEISHLSKLDDGTEVTFIGTVVEINTAWNTTYNNISVTVSDGNGNTFYIYRLATKVELCDTITVTGKIGSFNGSKQIAAGSTAVIGEKNHLLQPATCIKAASCSCGAVTEGEPKGHHYVDGVCECGAKDGIAKISYSGGTANMTDDNNATTVGLDATLFNVTSDKGTGTNHVGLNKDGSIRLYKGENALTISIADGYKINKITITFTEAKYAKNLQISVDGTVVTTTTGDVTVTVDELSGSEIILKNNGTEQVRFTSLVIEYEAQ